MPRVVTIVGDGAVGRTGSANRAVGNNDEGSAATTAAAATAVGGLEVTGVEIDTLALGRPTSLNGDDAKWSGWSVVVRSFEELVKTSLTTLLPHAEPDPVALVNSLQVDQTVLAASLDRYLLLLRLTAGLTDKNVVTSDGEGLKARHSLVARWDGT